MFYAHIWIIVFFQSITLFGLLNVTRQHGRVQKCAQGRMIASSLSALPKPTRTLTLVVSYPAFTRNHFQKISFNDYSNFRIQIFSVFGWCLAVRCPGSLSAFSPFRTGGGRHYSSRSESRSLRKDVGRHTTLQENVGKENNPTCAMWWINKKVRNMLSFIWVVFISCHRLEIPYTEEKVPP